MNENVFILHKEVVSDYELQERRIIAFGSEGEARAAYNKMCWEEKKRVSAEDGWVIDCSESQSARVDLSMEIYLDGWAAKDHTYITLEETKIV